MDEWLFGNYPLKNNQIFLERCIHSAMIGKPVSYMKDGTHIGKEQYPEGNWERYKTEYWARRMIWC